MKIIEKYFPCLTNTQKEQFSRLAGLYEEWNSKINVISRKDIEQLYERHVLHSLSIAKVISFKPQTSVLDVGTGGGFPGIPLAILFPDVQFELIDSIGKKIKVVNEITSALRLTNVTAIQTRAEDVEQKFDFVVSRAVTAFPQFVALVKNRISEQNTNDLPNGILYLKGGNFEEEIAPFEKSVRIYELQHFFSEEFFETKKLIHLALKIKTGDQINLIK